MSSDIWSLMATAKATPDGRRGARAGRIVRVTDEAIERIRQIIMSGEWGPGTRLPRESDLAARLGLSRNSLREAVRALSLLRVLEVRQGDGTYVSSLEPDLLLESTRFVSHLLADRTAIDAHDPELARTVAAAHVANSEHWLRVDLAAIEAAKPSAH